MHPDDGRTWLRHCLATLAYHAGKVIGDPGYHLIHCSVSGGDALRESLQIPVLPVPAVIPHARTDSEALGSVQEPNYCHMAAEEMRLNIRDLGSVLGRDTDCARFLLSRLLGDVVLRPDGQGLVAEVRGNLGVLLEDVPSIGAGRGILRLPPWPRMTRTIA